MARVALARSDRSVASVVTIDWPARRGPIHLSIAHALVRQARHDFLLIAKGPLSGRSLVGSATATLTTVSVQSGGLIEAQVEGPLAHGLTRLGIDALAVVGASSSLQGLVLRGFGDHVSLSWESARVPADSAVWETDTAVRGEAADCVLTTGALGMDGHGAASVVVNNGFPTTQGGVGARLGALNLKYIVLGGSGEIPQPSPAESSATAAYEAALMANPLTRSEREYPGFAMWPAAELVGYAATRGFAGDSGPGIENFSGPSMMTYAADDGAHACPGCPQWCLKSFRSGADVPLDGGRAHQLGVSAFALHLDQSDPRTLVEFNQACHDLGVEHLAAVEALHRSEVALADIRGAILGSLQNYPDGFGGAMRVKGMAIPPFDPRGNQGLGLGMAMNPTGPRYDVLEHDIDFDADQPWMGRENLGRDFGIPSGGIPMATLDTRRHDATVKLWLAWSALDALGLCEYAAPPTRELTIEAICAVVSELEGGAFGGADYQRLGRLRLAVLRATNAALGLAPEADDLPSHFFDNAVVQGRLAGAVIDRTEFEAARAVVAKALGWSLEGGLVDRELEAEVSELADAAWSHLEGALS